MSTVIAFPRRNTRAKKAVPVRDGATLFVHCRKTSLIAHLARPRIDRVAATAR